MSIDDEKKKKLQAMLEQLRLSFLEELPERLDDMERKVMALEGTESPHELSMELFRQVHSLKGIAGTHGLQIVTTICHHFEDQIQQFSDQYQDNCLQYIDLMRLALEQANVASPDFSEIENALYHLRKKSTDEKILGILVELSKSNAALIKSILEERNIAVTVVATGIDALNSLLVEKYDFLISAREVGAFNGMALVAGLRISDCINKDIKSIFISSNTNNAFYPGCEPDAIVIKNAKMGENIIAALETLLPELSL